MADHADQDGHDNPEVTALPDTTGSVEAYEVDDGIVLYDVNNPLAWVQTNYWQSLDERR